MRPHLEGVSKQRLYVQGRAVALRPSTCSGGGRRGHVALPLVGSRVSSDELTTNTKLVLKQ